MADSNELRALSRKLEKLQDAARGKVLRSAAMAGASITIKRARQTIPKGRYAHKTYKGRLVGPGFASRNIRRRSRLSRDKQAAFVDMGVSREAFYVMQFLHLGTSTIAPDPFFADALEHTQKDVVAAIAKKLKQNIEKAAR